MNPAWRTGVRDVAAKHKLRRTGIDAKVNVILGSNRQGPASRTYLATPPSSTTKADDNSKFLQ